MDDEDKIIKFKDDNDYLKIVLVNWKHLKNIVVIT